MKGVYNMHQPDEKLAFAQKLAAGYFSSALVSLNKANANIHTWKRTFSFHLLCVPCIIHCLTSAVMTFIALTTDQEAPGEGGDLDGKLRDSPCDCRRINVSFK